MACVLRERRRRAGRVSAGLARLLATSARGERRPAGCGGSVRAAGRSPGPSSASGAGPCARGPGSPAAEPAPPSAETDETLLGARRGCDGPRQGVPDARASRSAPRPPRLRAGRRPCARARAARPQADTRAPGAGSGLGAAGWVRGRDARGRPAQARGDLLRDDRLRDRAHLRPPGASLAPAGDRDRPLSGSRSRRRSTGDCSSS